MIETALLSPKPPTIGDPLQYIAIRMMAALQAGLNDVVEIRKLRTELIETLLQASPKSLTAAAGTVQQLRTVLYKAGLMYLPRTADENALADRLRITLKAGGFDGGGAHAAMAAMLLGSAYEFPFLTKFDLCPEWLAQPYIAYLFSFPDMFLFSGDVERFGDHLESLFSWAWSLFQEQGRAARWMSLLYVSAYECNLIQAYFVNRNLRTLLAQRSRLFEGTLQNAGYSLEYAFRRKSVMPKRIKVGMLMQNLTPRTETFHNLSYFEHLDQSEFEMKLYAFEWYGSSLELYCQERVGSVTILPKDDLQTQAARVWADDLDVMLIANNVTAVPNTTALLGAHKLARVQIALMDSPLTTGFRSNDVFLSSKWNEPSSGAQEQYSERLLQMEGALNCYAYHYDNEPAQLRLERAHLKVPEGAVLFYSGANFYKIVPELFEAWAKILSKVPGSILVLMPYNPSWSSEYVKGPFTQRVRAQLTANGVGLDRLRVIEPVPTRADVQAVMRLCDVYLDSYPFAGACSMVDAVSTGLPIVARYGETARSRHALATLGPMGLGDLAASDEDTYIQKAVAMGSSAALREQTTGRIKAALEGQPHIFDTAGFAKRFAPVLKAEFERYVRESGEKIKAETPIPTALAHAVQAAASTARFQAFTDVSVIKQVVLPYFRALQHVNPGSFHLVDVGACYGQLAVPFLREGWTTDLFEPDSGARDVLNGQVAPFAEKCRVHPFAASDRAQPDMPFHRAVHHGLSGLSASLYGATAEVTTIRCVRLDEILAEQNVNRVDFLKIDAEGWDFEVLAGHDFERLAPTMVFVEFGAERQQPKLAGVLEEMTARGYSALLFIYTDDGNFKKGIWDHRLISVLPGTRVAELGPEAFGNILFYPEGDQTVPLAFADLFNAFAQK